MHSSRESSQPRDQTQASHIAGSFFTIWATSEAQEYWSRYNLSVLQEIFPAQESNCGLSACIAGRFFTSWATRDASVRSTKVQIFLSYSKEKYSENMNSFFYLAQSVLSRLRFDPFPALIIDFVGTCKLWPRQNPAAFLFL